MRSKVLSISLIIDIFRLIEMRSFRHFVEKKPIWVQDSSLVIPGRREVDRSLAQYTGGMVKVY